MTKLALYDTQFQNQVLNSENAFIIDDLVEQGYYPWIKMPDCMPSQEYIPMPEVQDKDLADILSTEVLEQGTDRVKVKFIVNNPSGETITDIKIKNMDCYIIEQQYEGKVSVVLAELKNPIAYVSRYSVLSITTKGAYNLPYTRNFEDGERLIYVDFYREIHTIEDWKEMNQSPTENYMLMEDLNFINESSNQISITNTYTGKLEGNGHVLKNIRMDSNQKSGIFNMVDGKISNLNIESFVWKDSNASNLGFISNLDKNAEIDNIHIKDMEISGKSDVIYVGGLVGAVSGGKIRNASVSDLKITIDQRRYGETYVGGIVRSC